ncbi:hypothetical protein BJX65DRAFT_285475, partial [Aspergillus insuetus]
MNGPSMDVSRPKREGKAVQGSHQQQPSSLTLLVLPGLMAPTQLEYCSSFSFSFLICFSLSVCLCIRTFRFDVYFRDFFEQPSRLCLATLYVRISLEYICHQQKYSYNV